MKGKKPHLDFVSRPVLDGSEELYSQNSAWQNTEQKFTLAQVREWISAGQLKEKREVFFAQSDNQTEFTLSGTSVLPELSEVWFEKLKLTYAQSYRIVKDKLIYSGTDFQIYTGEQVEIKYLYRTQST